MFEIKLIKIHIINLIVCLILGGLQSTTISDHFEDKSTNNHNNIKNLYDNHSNIVFNTDQYNNTNVQLNHILFTQPPNEIEYATTYATPRFDWDDTEEEILENLSFSTVKPQSRCLLDSIKLFLIWWSNRNGTLKESNVLHVSSHQQKLDLSYRNIATDEEVLTLIPENMTTVIISLAYNSLTKVPFQTLQLMANSLQYLSLKGNKFDDAAWKLDGSKENRCILYEEDLKFPTNRDYLRIFRNSQTNIVWATFPYMPSLLELDISDCQIEYIGKRAFKNLTNLKHLYMSHNNIVTIPEDTFFHTRSLRLLDLSFSNINKNTFESIHSSSNAVPIMKIIWGINIEKRVFRYLPKLQYLDLSYSKLSGNSTLALARIGHNLKYLSLCYTSFPDFNKRIFKNASLIGLDLSGNTNAACQIGADFFEGLSESLQFLFFENANLRDLSWLKPLHSLRFLALACNNINILLAENFKGLKQLQILDLTSNQVANWYSPVFRHNENLRLLSLRENNINVVTPEMLKDFSILMLLSIGKNNFICDCELYDLMDKAILNNQQAQCKGSIWQELKDIIHINYINLAHVFHNFDLFAHTSSRSPDVSSLLVAQNLYKLKQPTKKFMITQYVKNKTKIRYILNALKRFNISKSCLYQNKTYDSKIFNIEQLKLQLYDYADEHYWCYNATQKQHLIGLTNCQRNSLPTNIEQQLKNLSTYILISVFSTISMIIIAIFIYMKRWHIYYYYSSFKSAALLSIVSKDKRNKFNNLCNENPRMVYDIFVSYCQNDRDWIVGELMPNLEESSDISICLHERDFQVGVTILDNIVSCMERSKVLMLIISSSFLLSHWCQFEMQLAQHHILDLNKDNLILVFLEDIPRSKRPKNLHFLMQVKTYIRWPSGKSKADVHPEEYKIFWKRLKRCIRSIDLGPSESKA